MTRPVVNRPECAKAIDLRMLDAIASALDLTIRQRPLRALELHQRIRPGLLGWRRILQIRGLTLEEEGSFVLRGQAVFNHLSRSHLVTIATSNGQTPAGGGELALAFHLTMASDQATFGFPEVGLGLIPGWEGTQRLCRRVGAARATLIALTDERLSATDDQSTGLIDRVVAEDHRMQYAALSIIASTPVAVQACKRAIERGAQVPFAEAPDEEADAWPAAFAGADRIEEISAFLDRRRSRLANL